MLNLNELKQKPIIKYPLFWEYKIILQKDENARIMVEKILLSLSDDRSEILPIDLSKTMDEIELDIINFVLKMENQNHSQAAARLGISRSTIWRKLNGARRQAALSATQPPEA